MDYTSLYLSERRASHLSGFCPSTVPSGWWGLGRKVHGGNSKPRILWFPNEKLGKITGILGWERRGGKGRGGGRGGEGKGREGSGGEPRRKERKQR